MNTILLNASQAGSVNQISWDWSNITSSSLMMALVGVCVVFSALIILAVVYTNMPKILNIRVKNWFKQEKGRVPTKEELNIPGEVNAAIGAALHLYFNDLHDFENTKLTIQREIKRQSPWSDKQQMLYQHPVKSNK